MHEFENALGYVFRNRRLMTVALTHSSLSGESGVEHNQRLEFLGDAVLQLVMSERLYRDNPRLMEGPLSRLRARSVQESALCDGARRLGLGTYLRVGHGEELQGGREKPSILADAMEAVLGAVYLDGGLDAARSIVERFLPTAPEQAARDNKTELQEKLQSGGGETPIYRITQEEGPPHRREFTAVVMLAGEVIGEGNGNSKKSAEQNAASDALSRLKKKPKKGK